MYKLGIYLFLLLFLNISYGQDCPTAESETEQTSSQFKVDHGVGYIWHDKEENTPLIYPKERGISAIRFGAFWVAGKDSENTLKVSHQMIGPGFNLRASWFAGPHDPETNCEAWDRRFELNKTDLEIFKADLTDGKIDNPIPIAVLGWPGNGNPHFITIHGFEMPNSNYGYAAFEDVDGDKIYDPEKGDFPINNGANHTSWGVMNDLFSKEIHPPVGVEIQLTANTFDNQGEALDNSIIYEVKLINKSGGRLTDMGFTIWVDPDLGCGKDDYFGCTPEHNLVQIYNEDGIDGETGIVCSDGVKTYEDEIPLIGIKVLEPFTGTNDEALSLSSFIYYSIGIDGFDQISVPNNNPEELYNNMKGLWRDGSSMTRGGHGIGGSLLTKFAFPDPPNQDDGWSMCGADLPFDERVMLLNFTPFELDHNQSNTMTFSVTGVENVPHPCPDISPLIERTDALEEIWNDRILTSTNSFSSFQNYDLTISPNPTSDMISISLTGKEKIEKIELVNLQGQAIKVLSNLGKASMQMDLRALNSGAYILLVRSDLGKSYNRKVIKIN